MARAKNMSRAEARRRTREMTRAELAAEQQAEDDALDETGSVSTATATTTEPRRRGMLFKWPDIRADIKSLPDMLLRTRRLLWLPFILVLVGFVLALVYGALPPQIQQYSLLYFQYFFAPQALFTYFIGGFLATRASYLVGLILGTMTGILWGVVFVVNPSATTDSATLGGDTASTLGTILVASMVLGLVSAGFAGWYRDFLRGMQTRSRERQMERENQAKARRRDERRSAKGLPVS